ncbi:MAG: hypothetical protein HOZ81_02400 [Streptomyces sp.]|nr:hypothetical protein [Streptomyces sp.]
MNNLTRTCLAWEVTPVPGGGRGVLFDQCSRPSALWYWQPMGGHKFTLRTFSGPDLCLSKADYGEDPEHLRLKSCPNHSYESNPNMIWEWFKAQA